MGFNPIEDRPTHACAQSGQSYAQAGKISLPNSLTRRSTAQIHPQVLVLSEKLFSTTLPSHLQPLRNPPPEEAKRMRRNRSGVAADDWGGDGQQSFEYRNPRRKKRSG